ncbi:MAG: tail fiber domain-containing protein [Patescibacteria group bacterium]
MNLRRFFSYSLVAVGALILSAGLQVYAFSEPNTAPPNADVDAPLTTGATEQSKSGGLILNTGGSTNGLIVQSGNVGVGTTSPTALLGIQGAIGVNSSQLYLAANGKVGIGTTVTSNNEHTIIYLPNNKDLAGVNSGGAAAFPLIGMGSSDKITIDRDALGSTFGGNVGIGTTVANDKLDVAGRIRISTNATSPGTNIASIYRGAATGLTLTGNTASTYSWDLVNNLGNDVLFNPVGTTVASFGGSVGIGTVAPDFKLDVYGALGALRLNNPSGDLDTHLQVKDYLWRLIVGGTGTSYGVGAGGLGFTSGGTYALKLLGNYVTVPYSLGVGMANNPGTYTLAVTGDAWVTSGAWSGSDLRWKKNIQPITGALDTVMQLSGVSYLWRKDEFPQNNFDDKAHFGLIAQDVEKIVPELVTTGPDGYKGIDYNGLAPLLIGSTQELQRIIMNQQNEIEELKARVSDLENKMLK